MLLTMPTYCAANTFSNVNDIFFFLRISRAPRCQFGGAREMRPHSEKTGCPCQPRSSYLRQRVPDLPQPHAAVANRAITRITMRLNWRRIFLLNESGRPVRAVTEETNRGRDEGERKGMDGGSVASRGRRGLGGCGDDLTSSA